MKQNKTILASAYAINPYKGSEDGMGWNFVRQIARFNNVIAITRENNRHDIERFITENPDPIHENIQFLYFDLPYWMRFWKKGSRGAMLYYWLWQQAIVRFVKKQKIRFDIVHNVNFHNDWTPSYLWKLNKPFVWGPVGHHPIIPAQYLKPFSRRYWIKDRLTWLVKKGFWNLSPALRKTVQKADKVLFMNPSVPDVLHLKYNQGVRMPSVATEDFGYSPIRPDTAFHVISAGRLVPLKGFDLSIRAFARLLDSLPQPERKNCALTIVGSGPEKAFFQSLCTQLGVAENVTFIDWIARKDLLELYKTSSAFLFPSHEGAGMVVAEAMSFGLPVICLDNSGPGAFVDESCAFAIPVQGYKETVASLGDALIRLNASPALNRDMGKAARALFESNFHWNRRGEALKNIYDQIAL